MFKFAILSMIVTSSLALGQNVCSVYDQNFVVKTELRTTTEQSQCWINITDLQKGLCAIRLKAEGAVIKAGTRMKPVGVAPYGCLGSVLISSESYQCKGSTGEHYFVHDISRGSSVSGDFQVLISSAFEAQSLDGRNVLVSVGCTAEMEKNTNVITGLANRARLMSLKAAYAEHFKSLLKDTSGETSVQVHSIPD